MIQETIMIRIAIILSKLKEDRRAVTALEYGLLASIIVATIMVGFTTLASSLSKSFSTIGSSL
jgi:Flp pilus assembly pilin Flp